MPENENLDATVEDHERSADRTAWALPGYELGAIIGRGGMGEVFAARDAQIDREVAVKRLRGSQPSPDAIARFMREAKIQARLDHPAIVPVHSVGTDDHGFPYFTMKRLAGRTLSDKLADGPMQPLLRAFVDVCFAIELAHTRGIVHRDLKPSNIMIGDYNDVYVLDWGIARELATGRVSQPSIGASLPGTTAAGAILGTLGYMPPEQVRGEEVGAAADVYALGAILFEILAGQPLHPPKGALASTLDEPTASPAARRPDRAVPPELDELCTAALAEAAAERPSARQLAERVQRYLDGDRDLERRRTLAREHLAIARDALDPGRRADRAKAAQAAGRALALDPESAEAAQLVAQLLLEPPREMPAELQLVLEAKEREIDRQRSRRAIPAFLAIFLWVPFLPLFDVRSWSNLIGLLVACTLIAGLSWLNWRRGRVPTWVMMLANSCVAIAFSRVASPFVLMPMLVCGQTLAVTTSAWVDDRRWTIVPWLVATLGAPLVFERIGWFEPTWTVAPDGLLTWSGILRMHSTVDVWAVIVGQLSLGVVVTAYALAITRARRTAQRESYIQSWHLQQMILPRAASRLR